MTDWITINGSIMPPPTSYKVLVSDLDSENSTRNEAGVLVRDRIRAGVYKIEATWKVPVSRLSLLVNAVQPKSFTVRFFDLTTASYKTKTMYAGDRTASVLLQKSNSGETLCDFSCNLIEF